MPLEIVRNDITKMKVDAIVNAANSSLKQGGGVCGAIFCAAGAKKLQAECGLIGHCDTGAAVMTGGYALPAKHIIHTVGPVWQNGSHNEEKLLTDCYLSSLRLACEANLNSIAFPLISSGIFGYPKDKAIQPAVSAIGAFLLDHDMAVYLVFYDAETYTLGEKLFQS
ncbi:MAG: macro domain-containing protein [Oscillospiraceae bacterium]